MEKDDVTKFDELASAVKNHGDLSVWKKNPHTASFVSLLSELNKIPKTSLPEPDLFRVRGQILDRIAVAAVRPNQNFSFVDFISTFNLRMTAGIVGSLMIVVSLTAATAVAALQSVPGSALYPLKKVAESIELKLTPNDQIASIQIKFAGNRAEELQQVLENKQSGKITDQEAQKIVTSTLKDLQTTTTAAVSATGKQTKSTAIVTKLNDISNKLKAASIESEGQVKIELEKALESTQISQEQAIKNLEQAGLIVENLPITIDSFLKASGKLTDVSTTSVSIGTAKFLLTNATVYINVKAEDLTAGQLVDIQSQIKDNKSYALKITLVDTPVEDPETKTETPESDTNSEPQ